MAMMLPPMASRRLLSAGISAMHGPHQVAMVVYMIKRCSSVVLIRGSSVGVRRLTRPDFEIPEPLAYGATTKDAPSGPFAESS